jgi:hypothetical protein
VLFDNKTLRLVEVIRGAECMVSSAEIVAALGPLAEKVKISKARAAYDEFEMVEDQDAPVAGATTKSFMGRINVKAVLAVVAVGALTVGSFFAGEHKGFEGILPPPTHYLKPAFQAGAGSRSRT